MSDRPVPSASADANPQTEDQLILVDLLDRQIGTMGKLEAHQTATLHRAFSVFLWRVETGRPQVLLQQRAAGKYHSGGLWANSCCSHPRVGETLDVAVPRRLNQELGITPELAAAHLQPPRECGHFVYRSAYANGLTEFEFDHVFVARWDGPLDAFAPDSEEVAFLRWVDTSVVEEDLRLAPGRYSSWLIGALPVALAAIEAALA